jgi:phosphoserine phosphatase
MHNPLEKICLVITFIAHPHHKTSLAASAAWQGALAAWLQGQGLFVAADNSARPQAAPGELPLRALGPPHCPELAVDMHIELPVPLYEPLKAWLRAHHGPSTPHPLYNGVDAILQPIAGRRKAILLADMDATMVEEETLDELAAHLGLKEKIAAITAKAMDGQIDFPTALRQRVALLAGLSTSSLEKTINNIHYMPGGACLIATLRHAQRRCVLVSGGFDVFTRHVAAQLGFHQNYANRLEIENEALTGQVLPPILDKAAKLAILQQECAALGISLCDAATIGDGANDLPMLQAAGLGIAFHAKPSVALAAHHVLHYNDLTAMLYAQGYAYHEWRMAPAL